MSKTLNALAAALSLVALSAAAAPVTMSFEASGFQNLGRGEQLATPVQGSVTWEAPNPGNLADPIGALLAIDLQIGGHRYTLGEVAMNASSAQSTLIGATARGINVLVGDGGANDFMLIFDRTKPALSFFGFTLKGQSNTLWAYASHQSVRYEVQQAVPEPGSALLATLALAAGGLAWRRRRSAAHYAFSVQA